MPAPQEKRAEEELKSKHKKEKKDKKEKKRQRALEEEEKAASTPTPSTQEPVAALTEAASEEPPSKKAKKDGHSESKDEKKKRKEEKRKAKAEKAAATSSSTSTPILAPTSSTTKTVGVKTDPAAARAFMEANNITLEAPEESEEKPPLPMLNFDELDGKVDDSIKKTIDGQGFSKPTPIQSCCWPVLLQGKDVVGVAETGWVKEEEMGRAIYLCGRPVERENWG